MRSEGQQLRKMREAELKKRDKATLRELATRIKSHRHARRARLTEIRGLCRIGRAKLKERVAKLRHDTLEQLRDTIARLREAERDECHTSQTTERKKLTEQIDAARRELELERRSFRDRYGRKSSRVGSQQKAKERASESFDEVARNLPSELLAVWKKVHGKIKGSARMSRTEAFLHWAEENPDDVHGVLYREADRDVARLIAEQQKVERRLAKTRGYDDPEAEAGALAGIPF